MDRDRLSDPYYQIDSENWCRDLLQLPFVTFPDIYVYFVMKKGLYTCQEMKTYRPLEAIFWLSILKAVMSKRSWQMKFQLQAGTLFSWRLRCYPVKELKWRPIPMKPGFFVRSQAKLLLDIAPAWLGEPRYLFMPLPNLPGVLELRHHQFLSFTHQATNISFKIFVPIILLLLLIKHCTYLGDT